MTNTEAGMFLVKKVKNLGHGVKKYGNTLLTIHLQPFGLPSIVCDILMPLLIDESQGQKVKYLGHRVTKYTFMAITLQA